MKISIEGTEYPLFEAIGQASLGDMGVVNKHGANVRTIKTAFERVLKLMAEGGSGFDLWEDEDYILNITAVVYLALRRAGHKISFEDAADVPGAAVFLVMEDADADPKDEDQPLPTLTT